MTFNNASALILFILIPSLLIFIIWRERVRLFIRRELVSADLVNTLFPSVNSRLRVLKAIFWLLAIVALIVAMARPVWGVDLDVIETQGVSVVFALDVSNSMAADDLLPSRLDRAKLGIRDLFGALAGNEVGLVLFAGTAFIQLPLTTDTVSAVNFLNAAGVDSITQQGTDLQSAVDTAIKAFGENSPAARIIILMTDGENHEGGIEAVARQAETAGVTIHAIGYGKPEGSPVPILDENGAIIDYRTDENNNVIFSSLDEATLQQLTSLTGGYYQRATANGSEIVNLANRIQEVEAGLLDNRTQQRGVERFGIFVALALLALSIEIVLPETRERATL